jgi:protein phosphatase
MTGPSTGVRVTAASVTDRGLNDKRPLNEDSLICDVERGVFAVADGVGGAEAGEVASETAVEVIQQAFAHHKDGDDAEDLMEIAIQRANVSIFQMAREHPRFAMMATTIVALHVNGRHVTIGHVGDSRLYRLTPAGILKRETEDHSVVEEEVRAGRMTAAQAATHPSRNVISRALGAEQAVEVDMKTLDVEDGTTFLLCSDGITRHVNDEEIGAVLRSKSSLDDACSELKRLCFERGAEDNLTAVLVRIGERTDAALSDDQAFDDERTLISERPAVATTSDATTSGEMLAAHFKRPFDADQSTVADETPGVVSAGANSGPAAPRKRGGAGRVLGVLLLLVAASAAAFYGGMFLESRGGLKALREGGLKGLQEGAPLLAPAPSPVPETADERFERLRRAVDVAPAAEAARMEAESGGQPLNSPDPEFLYLYGRALLRTGRPKDAASAFERAIQRVNENPTARNAQLKIDARLAEIAANLRADDINKSREAAKAFDEFQMPAQSSAPANPGGAQTNPTPAQANPAGSPGVFQ